MSNLMHISNTKNDISNGFGPIMHRRQCGTRVHIHLLPWTLDNSSTAKKNCTVTKRDRRNKKVADVESYNASQETWGGFHPCLKNFSCPTSEHATSFWRNFRERSSKSAGHIVLPPPWWWSSWLKRPDTVQVDAVLHHAGSAAAAASACLFWVKSCVDSMWY